MITLTQIRDNITEAIRNSGLTQTELGKRLGIKQQTVAQYLSGRAMPALDTFANLCAVLDLDANEILCLTAQPSGHGAPGSDNRHHNVNVYHISGNNNNVR